jgi:hypothetical protein
MWTSTGRSDGGGDPIDLRERPRTRGEDDSDEIVDAVLVDEVPPGAQVVESEVIEDDGSARRRTSRRSRI